MNPLRVVYVFAVLTVSLLILAGTRLSTINYRLNRFLQKSVSRFHDSSQPCTFAALRQAYWKEDYFPGGGKWFEVNGTPYFQPDMCMFRYPRVTEAFMAKCLAKANVSYVITMGDSTASRYSNGLQKTSTMKCFLQRAEKLEEGGFLSDKNYFTPDMPEETRTFVKAKFRFCSGCASNIKQCTLEHQNTSYGVSVEHIAQTMILDDTLEIVFPSYQKANKEIGEIWAITMQELVFRYYLKDKNPDVFLIFLPFAHAKRNMALSRLPMEIKYYIGLLEEYLPKTTKLVFMTSYGEFETARTNMYWKNRLFDGLLAREKIDRMNHVLYEVIKDDLLKEDGRYFGFFDLIDVSRDRGNWSTDAVHMKPVWYESIMSMFWETYCNSVLLDRF